MPHPLAPLRSALYVPGANARALEKARTIAADALILDLEDSVAPEAKVRAREQVAATLAAGVRAAIVTVRVNAIGTPWHVEDVTATVAAGVHAVVLPKVGGEHDIQTLEHELGGAEIGVWAMIETPTGVLSAASLAAASDRLQALVLGTNDLLAELHAEPDGERAALRHSLGACVLAARAHRKLVLDGVFNDVQDLEAFKRECLQGKRLGFDGKTLIHPAQVEPCNGVYSPSAQELAQARRVLEAFAAARRRGEAVTTLDGRMLERMHVDAARRALALGGPARLDCEIN